MPGAADGLSAAQFATLLGRFDAIDAKLSKLDLLDERLRTTEELVTKLAGRVAALEGAAQVGEDADMAEAGSDATRKRPRSQPAGSRGTFADVARRAASLPPGQRSRGPGGASTLRESPTDPCRLVLGRFPVDLTRSALEKFVADHVKPHIEEEAWTGLTVRARNFSRYVILDFKTEADAETALRELRDQRMEFEGAELRLRRDRTDRQRLLGRVLGRLFEAVRTHLGGNAGMGDKRLFSDTIRGRLWLQDGDRAVTLFYIDVRDEPFEMRVRGEAAALQKLGAGELGGRWAEEALEGVRPRL